MELPKPRDLKYHDWDESVEPMVSIACLTYNHGKFIQEAIESFLNQRTTFKVEILVHDDASEDRTPSIIKWYETSYPKLIRAIYQNENQYSKGNHPSIINLNRARGKYIALCEGDDYWTDPLKLQKQVEFLEGNPSFTVCVGGYTRLIESDQSEMEVIHNSESLENSDGFPFGLEEMEKSWLTKTLTALVRKKEYDKFDFNKYKYYRDIHFYYHLIKGHKAYYFKENFGVYRIHEGGVNSMKEGKTNKIAAYNCYKELYLYNKDSFTRKMYLNSVLTLFSFNMYNRYEDNNLITNFRLFKESISLVQTVSDFKKLILAFLKRDFKDSLKANFKK